MTKPPTPNITTTRLTKVMLGISLFIFFLYPSADADLGWHLRYGEEFLKTGQILKSNQFSFVMPGFAWINHSWFFDIIAALIFKYAGFIGLTVVGSLLITTSYLLIIQSFPLHWWLVSTVLYMFFGQHLYNTGLRSQHLSLLFTAVVLSLFLHTYKTKKIKPLIVLPFIMLIWANAHGQFLLGLATIFLLSISLLVYKTSNIKHSTVISVLFFSCLITLFNPFGAGLIFTSIQHLTSPLLQNVYEWMPWELNTPRMGILLAYIFTSSFILLKTPSKNIGLTMAFFAYGLLAIKARRLIPFFSLVSFATIGFSLNSFRLKIRLKPLKNPAYYFISSILILFISVSAALKRPILSQSWDTYCHSTVLCSENALRVMSDLPVSGKVFNSYRLGGWLIYRYPQIPVYIDGRMTLWQNPQGFTPFQEYLTLIHARSGSKEIFYRYNFDYVIIQPQYALAGVLENQEKWPILYQDDAVMLFVNPRRPKL